MPQLYEVTLTEFVADGVATEDKTYVAAMTMVDPTGAFFLIAADQAPIAVIANGYWTNARVRKLEKGEMQ